MDWQKLKFAGEQIVHSVFQIQMSMKSVFSESDCSYSMVTSTEANYVYDSGTLLVR